MLFSGMRPNEVLQLTADDIETRDGVLGFAIGDDGAKRLKTPSARRFIPIHPELRSQGFLDYAERIRERCGASAPLFGEIKPSATRAIAESW